MLFEPSKSAGPILDCGVLLFATVCLLGFLSFLCFLHSRRLFTEELVLLSKVLNTKTRRRPKSHLKRRRGNSVASTSSPDELAWTKVCTEGLKRFLNDQLRLSHHTRKWFVVNAAQQTIHASDPSLPIPSNSLEREQLAMRLEDAAVRATLRAEATGRVRAELAHAHRCLDAVQSMERSTRCENQALKGELQAVKGELQGLKGEMQALKGENQALRGENQALKAELTVTHADLLTIREVFRDLRHDCLCPIRHTPMRCPVVAADGHSYERRAIERWVWKHGTSPMTNMALPNSVFVPNFLAQKVVECLGKAEPSWINIAPDESESDESSDNTPHAWSSDHSSDRESTQRTQQTQQTPQTQASAASSHFSVDVYNGQAAEVLRALLTNGSAPVEALWSVRSEVTDHINDID